MHKFLNVGDGLVSLRGKKLIFSTNLDSIKDVDIALTRQGRCFDILTFDKLNETEAQKLAKKFNLDLQSKLSEYSIAEVFYGC